ncbi:endonuclease-reverse transcriptase [Plakobranchus ocellatus]|uniref:Endonuclease-reverse transcriptase n=1 Tax=Plakobranchus ocellatus TaxID=259542 RepID=A0AAV3YDU4_9GAST|nr:endonuclease-reverse transcriptase [Plakobranchus ocellatus]
MVKWRKGNERGVEGRKKKKGGEEEDKEKEEEEEEEEDEFKSEQKMEEWFPVTKGVRQGCILSPHLFSLYTEEIMRDVEFDPRKDEYDEPRLQGLPIRDLRYADDTALLSTTTEGLEKLIKAVKEHSEQKGLHLNVKKTKIMDIDKCKKEARIQIEGEEIERVKSFEYLGARIEANGKTTPEIRRRLARATAKLQKMEKIWKGQDVHTKVRILKSIIFPTATYGCEAWTINKTDSKRITALELKCYRKILRISWTEKIRNEEVLIKISTKTPILLQSMKKTKTYILWAYQTPPNP